MSLNVTSNFMNTKDLESIAPLSTTINTDRRKIKAEIIQDDVLHALSKLASDNELFDCVVMDPPYCSGGLTPTQITRRGVDKYCKTKTLGDFEDGMSGISFYRYMLEVFRESRGVLTKPGYLFCFIDWRMYPVIYQALEGAGVCLRGAITWNKLNSRPNFGQFRQDSEFILYGTNGKDKTRNIGNHSVITCPSPLMSDRIHPTQKPVKVYAELYKILNPNGRILELFSGSTAGGVAAIHSGFDYIGVESSPFYVATSRKRLREELEKACFLGDKTTVESQTVAPKLF